MYELHTIKQIHDSHLFKVKVINNDTTIIDDNQNYQDIAMVLSLPVCLIVYSVKLLIKDGITF